MIWTKNCHPRDGFKRQINEKVRGGFFFLIQCKSSKHVVAAPKRTRICLVRFKFISLNDVVRIALLIIMCRNPGDSLLVANDSSNEF